MAALALADMFVIAASTLTALVCLFFTDIHVCVHGGPGSGRHVCYHSQYIDGSSLFVFLQISTYVFMAALALADMFVITASTLTALVCLFFTDIHVCVHGGPGFGRHVCYRSQYSDCGSFLLERIFGQHRL